MIHLWMPEILLQLEPVCKGTFVSGEQLSAESRSPDRFRPGPVLP